LKYGIETPIRLPRKYSNPSSKDTLGLEEDRGGVLHIIFIIPMTVNDVTYLLSSEGLVAQIPEERREKNFS
jgi:hypothetical protein